MSAQSLSRRDAIAALAFGLPFALAAGGATAQPGIRFRAVHVDVSPLRSMVGDPTASWVEQELSGQLAEGLAPYLAPGDRAGATLVARINNIYFGPNSGGTGVLGSSQDTIEGVLLVMGPQGALAADTPLRAISSYYPNPFDQPLRVESNRWRVAALARAFAGWVPRQLGL